MITFDTILFWVAASIIIFVGIFINLFFIKEIVSEIRSMIIYRRNFYKELKKKRRECKKCSCLFTDIEYTKLQDHEVRLKFLEKHYLSFLPDHPRIDENELALRAKRHGEAVERKNEFEEFLRILREGHDISVLFESFVAKQAEYDSELKKKYEEVKASPGYIPPEERLKRPGVHIDVQRPSRSEDKPHEE